MTTHVFVMTDVVGSTALWEAHGDLMPDALAQHDQIVHGAMADQGGTVFKHTGDGMIAAFTDSDAAVRAALNALDALTAAGWGPTGALQIRVAIHAGAATERGGDYFGPPVNRVARINAIAHPGQVLVSDVARQLMTSAQGVDLGEHQLRDVAEPVRLWQLDDGEHPPVRALVRSRHNLPRMATEFVGRRSELDELCGLLAERQVVTIAGVGGCGKTRLAIEAAAAVANDYPGGVWFTDLTTERDGERVADRVLGSLGVNPGGDGRSTASLLREATGDDDTLLVVDNCEHLVDDVAELAEELLADAPSVTVLATSREPLSIDGERVWRIPNLRDGATDLFVARATSAGATGLEHHLELIQEICRDLDNIPLAIELAAAQAATLPLPELAARLDDRFALLGGGRRSGRRRQRQQTLQAMMDWSYALLTPDEQQLIEELSVFVGSFGLDAVDAVATPAPTPALQRLQSLVEQSLVAALTDDGRYRLLETVRLYALDRLAARDAVAEVRGRHLDWMRELVTTGRNGPDTAAWEAAARAEFESIGAAMEWAMEVGRPDVAFDLFTDAGLVWCAGHERGVMALGWLDRIPEPPASAPLDRARWLTTASGIHLNVGDLVSFFVTAVEAAALLEQIPTVERDGRWQWLSTAPLSVALIRLWTQGPDGIDEELDRIAELLTEPPPWFYVMLPYCRVELAILRDEPDALAAAETLYAVAGETSAFWEGGAREQLAFVLRHAGRHEEAIDLALASYHDPAITQTYRLRQVPVLVGAYVALGRFDEALAVIRWDHGPMLDPQRALVAAATLSALIVLLRALGDDDLEDAAVIALAASRTDGTHLTDHRRRRDLATVFDDIDGLVEQAGRRDKPTLAELRALVAELTERADAAVSARR
jgi:predicted ATPase/class 3 adenylate cyclase